MIFDQAFCDLALSCARLSDQRNPKFLPLTSPEQALAATIASTRPSNASNAVPRGRLLSAPAILAREAQVMPGELGEKVDGAQGVYKRENEVVTKTWPAVP